MRTRLLLVFSLCLVAQAAVVHIVYASFATVHPPSQAMPAGETLVERLNAACGPHRLYAVSAWPDKDFVEVTCDPPGDNNMYLVVVAR